MPVKIDNQFSKTHVQLATSPLSPRKLSRAEDRCATNKSATKKPTMEGNRVLMSLFGIISLSSLASSMVIFPVSKF